MTKTPEELTADWKAGKLRQCTYYIKIGDIVFIDFFNAETLKFTRFKEKYIDEVLALVPSYNKLQAIKEENAMLKKLLQQWQEIHNHMVKYHGYINHSEFHPTFIETEKFIDEVHHADTTRE